ncbi:MAG: hypothetical protein ACFE95_22180, partial [Candidatus Hodarchaeota archaeon]
LGNVIKGRINECQTMVIYVLFVIPRLKPLLLINIIGIENEASIMRPLGGGVGNVKYYIH